MLTLYDCLYPVDPEPGDGGPACFPRVEDSEIPALRQWCHAQTLPFRKATAIAFLNDIQTLAACIATYLNDANQAALEDKQALQRRWQSTAFYNRRGNRATRKGGVVGHLDKVCALMQRNHIIPTCCVWCR